MSKDCRDSLSRLFGHLLSALFEIRHCTRYMFDIFCDKAFLSLDLKSRGVSTLNIFF